MEGESVAETSNGSGPHFDASEHPMELQLEEEDEDEDQDEDEEEQGEEGEYEFRFRGEMDPLAFTNDDAFGLQPYKQFERLEHHHYQALAAKKRRAPPQPHCEVSTKKLRQEEDVTGASMEEIMEAMNVGFRKRPSKLKKRGRRKGSKNKVSPEVKRKLGDATLYYAQGHYEEAIQLLCEVIRLSPNLPDPYHTLGLIYNAMGDTKRALNFYMLAAHLTPKDASLWKLLVTWSIEQGNKGQARYCLSKAITANPQDISLWFHRASLCMELGDHQKAAEAYDQIAQLCPNDVKALSTATLLYKRCGQHEHAVSILEDYVKNHPDEADLSVVYLLAEIYMESNAHLKALEHINHAKQNCCVGKDVPFDLSIKGGICHLYLGNMEEAEAIFSFLQHKNASEHPDLVMEVANSFMSLEHFESALKYYMMREGDSGKKNGNLCLNIARCYLFLRKRVQAIDYFYRAVSELDESIDARLSLSSLLLEEGKDDEAISVLSPPIATDSSLYPNSGESKPWWLNGKIKVKLCQIYKAKGSLEAFVDVIFPVVRETLFLESIQQKVKVRKRLAHSDLLERIKVVDDQQTDTVFGFRPVASASDLSKAARARKLLKKKEMLKETKRTAALAPGSECNNDDSEIVAPQALREPPLPDFLKDEEHQCLIVDALLSLQRYWEALEIVNLCLRLASNTLSAEKKGELQALGAQVGYNIDDPTHGWDCARYIVSQNPNSFAAWNCYYKVISRLDGRHSKHNKFLHGMRVKHKDCIPPIIISGHQFTLISQHQIAAKEYLEAYKMMPDSPLINLCVGTALINLALGFRLQNKHQCLLQGIAFLYKNIGLCENNQEALYNTARAYHHVGLVSLATTYYQRVLATFEKDYPIPKLPNENIDFVEITYPGYCDLRREAAYNLHLIYKNSGAFDLARQVLKCYCTL